jgi:peptidoglycan endopeptidase LytE
VHVVAAFVAAFVLALAAASPAAAASRYVVAPHDTLFSIARRFRVPLPLLAQVNRLQDPSRIRAGDVLVIPDVAAGIAAAPARSTPPPAPPPATVPAAASTTPHAITPSRQGPRGQVSLAVPAVASESYIVRVGDTLYHLAKTHGTTVEALQTANGLASPAIAVGQVIRFPQPNVPHAPAAAPGEMAPPDLNVPAPPSPNDPAAPPTPPVRVGLAARVRASALAYRGTPYVWGGASPAGVDCSGLVYLVYAPYVAHLPRTSFDQWTAGAAVDRADLLPGDLVFFNTDGTGASHVGIYVGDGQFVHAAASAQRVVVDRLDAPYYLMHYVGARRIL